ncbi:MAG TPA: ferrous iron transport protein B [bacterium]|nr:ferrous iron transport protein B [bacterium]HOL46693.1 ferrous iron transport protein B [bacterium]HPQ18381.1 ferrous iron transport protein B [bacterium]
MSKKEKIPSIVLIGCPNVGKSVIYNKLVGKYTTVSNFPGTTVEYESGKTKLNGKEFLVIDTPGTYSLLPISEDERIARKVLIDFKPDIILNIVDAKNISRMLHLTLQLLEAKLPVILVLNMMDEAQSLGININTRKLENILGVPVIPTIATIGKGIEELKRRISEIQITDEFKINYEPEFHAIINNIADNINTDLSFDKKYLALLIIQNDKYFSDFNISINDEIINNLNHLKNKYSENFAIIISNKRKEKIDNILKDVITTEETKKKKFKKFLDYLFLHPFWGSIILVLILYYGLYQFVGVLGAGVLVDFLQNTLFGKYINPFIINIFENFLKIPENKIAFTFFDKIKFEIFNLFVGEYGIFTLALSYAIAIVFPIVMLFFLFFSILEDSGYLPRLACMLDIFCKKIGLNGKAVIPLILGLGCDTMATLSTRVLPTKRERLIATFLLALTIPCSAQLGVIMAILSVNKYAFLIWFFTIIFIFLISGFLLNKILPGKKQSFFLEIPPLRFPLLSNVLIKTYTRIIWYLKEVLPLFILISFYIWLGQLLKIFDLILYILSFIVKIIGLPSEAAKIFLFGFFRRDYGAAGLYDLNNSGILNFRNLIIASVVLTLFIPCVAQFLIMKKEHGTKITLLMTVLIIFLAFFIGFILNNILILVNFN